VTTIVLYALLAVMTEPRLAPCPTSPNCVSSDAEDARHRIAPLTIKGDASRSWAALASLLKDEPRMRVVEESDTYLHATARTRVFRFVDDVEFELRATEGIIAVRSASRVGRSDLGVNRRRVESIRERLRNAGVIE